MTREQLQEALTEMRRRSGTRSATDETIELAELAQEKMRARKDAAYLERNRVVAALTKCFPSKRTRTVIEGWSEDWHGAVYIDLPTGQLSWHFHDSHAHLFAHVPDGTVEWDGHDTQEKYRRLAALPQLSPAAAYEPEPKLRRGAHEAGMDLW